MFYHALSLKSCKAFPAGSHIPQRNIFAVKMKYDSATVNREEVPWMLAYKKCTAVKLVLASFGHLGPKQT